MPNPYFSFKQFTVYHDRCAMKVTTDACLFGAWLAAQLSLQQKPATHLLDVGTGTGLLSLMIAQKNSATIDAVEIDLSAAGQAAENFTKSPWSSRLRVIQTDVLQWQTAGLYDCIFANPPFYENDLLSENRQKNLAHHHHGLTLSSLFLFIRNHLTENGRFFLLLPAKRDPELKALLKNNALYLQQKVLVQQTLNHSPFRMMIQGCRKKIDTVREETIVIKNNENQYTASFTGLLKDYYLYL